MYMNMTMRRVAWSDRRPHAERQNLLAQHVHVVQFAGKRQLRLIEINTHHHPEPAPPRELERAVERLQRLGEAA